MKYFGIDYSMSKVGIALGDADARIAVPFTVLPGGDDVLARIVALAKSEHVDAFVLGMPIPFRAEQHTKQFDRVHAFATALRDASGLPVHEVDEVMTSREARRMQDDQGSNVAEDALAAMIILQEFLDSDTAGLGGRVG